MAWIELKLLADRELAPLMEAALENAGALAVTLDEGDDGCTDAGSVAQQQVLEPAPGETPLWCQLRITALFDASPEGSAQAEAAARMLAAQALAPPSLHRLQDQVWERLWLDGLQPQRFGHRLWVCPRGQVVTAADAVVIDLDPGLAFGTGHHATTALCLEWLDRSAITGRTLIDFGCGSGILAIAALKLGAARALAIDHDPQALEATLENARVNGVADRIATDAPERMPREAADLLVANILAGPLVALAPTLSPLIQPGGLLALSGILQHQAETVSEAYRTEFALDPPLVREDWVLISGRRRTKP
ncbi:MAG: 50S ribosomal protein L11 methyltransferase [Lamprobacter sp.]|uniref:50S ribosomal protein L11 methyltransferase n=1 Tax=Lamprobacter sp. TaxID=3100796 RepID=UPI002B261A9A|nr:50S ribosomal protein L11 methyltransferase [Lamprobacter sp.]MEA3638430.1 50S ribosomal protein L11 methyltransferase [Lamprobacter sp.]